MTELRFKELADTARDAVSPCGGDDEQGRMTLSSDVVEAEHEVLGSKGLRVVIVDDNEDNAELLAELLVSYEYRVQVASLGRELLELLEKELPDIVLVDIALPDMDGYEVAQLVRARFGKKVYLVALTGFYGTEVRLRAASAGFNAFVTKPFRHEHLLNELRGMP
jgi:CheY-like chemotaxis protein